MASIEERFQAAVNVIKGLPKNGPYQPSNGMMLKFYGYYKQATEGPCQQSKPSLWHLIDKAKWEAWNANRHLTKQQAMQKYVDELREIIETMSFTENVQNFVGSLNGLDNINLDELDMIAPGMREIAESHPNSPFNSRTNSPQHNVSDNNLVPDTSETVTSSFMNGNTNSEISTAADAETAPSVRPNYYHESVETSTNAYLNTNNNNCDNNNMTNGSIVDQSDDEYGDPVEMHHDLSEAVMHNSELLQQVQTAVLRMNADLALLSQRMGTLDKVVHEIRSTIQKSRTNIVSKSIRKYPKWWPFDDISPLWFVFLLLWPIAVRRLARMLSTQRRK